jgi:digeranylgeranylglycerophospholipid reductase
LPCFFAPQDAASKKGAWDVNVVHLAGRAMNPESVDVLIVGASFAGCACAIRAAQLGLRVRLIDKKNDVGAKLHTTGIIVCDAVNNNPFLQNIPAALTRRIETIRLFSPALSEVVLRSPGYYFLATDTPNLMRWLVAQAMNAGVEVRLGVAFSAAKIVAGRIAFPDQTTAKYLVGADGPQSKVARTFGLSRVQHFLYGVEHELTHTQVPDDNALYCFLTRQYARGYIGWASQGTHAVQIGTAVRYRTLQRKAAVLPDLAGFLNHVSPVLPLNLPLRHAQKSAVRAGLIPCGGLVKNFAASRVLLVGDAAGLVSPVTAGGIHTAWKHGWHMGEAIGYHLLRGDIDPGEVARRTYTRFTVKRVLRWGYDHFQRDWIFNTLLHTQAMRAAAQQVYFHRRG